jgi:hypothetical protein
MVYSPSEVCRVLKELHTFGGNLPLVESLTRRGVRFLVVGGLAVHHHAPERQADDLDLLVEQTAEVARSVAAALISINVRPEFTEEQFVNARKVQIKLKLLALYADIVTAGREFDFDEHWKQGHDALIGHTVVKVATVPTLLALLTGSDNPKHDADIVLLRGRLASVPVYPCPCCGYVVFDEPPGSFAICPICFWEDDVVQLRFPAWAVGANRASLIDAQQSFQRVGASKPGFAQNCRTPTAGDKRDLGWRPVDLATDNIEAPPSGVDMGKTHPADATALYYWRNTYWRRRA